MKTIIIQFFHHSQKDNQVNQFSKKYKLLAKEKIKGYKEFVDDNEAKGLYDKYKNGFAVDLEKGRPDFEHGVVVTGFGGDGIYPVTVEMVDDKNSSVYGLTKSVTITFIEDREV